MNKNFKDTTIVAATGNRHKIIEIESITKLFGMKVIAKGETAAGSRSGGGQVPLSRKIQRSKQRKS